LSVERPVRVAVIGAGLIAQRAHLPAYAAADEVEIAAIVSGHRETAEAAARQFGSPRVLDSWQAAVADPEIDAVDICTPNSLHAAIAIAAAKAGKHVLVEKPMATSLAEADAMVATAREAGVVLAVAHNLRFVPIYSAMQRLLADGAIGRIFSARGVFMHAGPDEFWGATSDWFWREGEAGGGSLLDMGIHMIDLLRWMVGRPVQEVSAMTARLLKPTFADDNAMVLMRFEGDILASVQSSWSARPVPDRQMAFHGELGNLMMGRSTEEPLVLNLQDGAGARKVLPPIPAASPFGDPFVDFVHAIQTHAPPLVTGEDGRTSLAIALVAYESARTGRVMQPG
jgi:UDP-N-acetylglucosamine 3-dehydrogenase